MWGHGGFTVVFTVEPCEEVVPHDSLTGVPQYIAGAVSVQECACIGDCMEGAVL